MTFRFTKGHGTGNDFVLYTDSDGTSELDAARVRSLCDRRTGIGADGVIRVVPGRFVEGVDPRHWCMDYRNADGSVGDMCGNGVRVFAHYLLQQGLAELDSDGVLPVSTRAGVKAVRVRGADYSVSMGQWQLGAEDVLVSAAGLPVARPGQVVNTGNEHVVVALADEAELEALDLSRAPELQPSNPEGVNVEFVVPGAISRTLGTVRMRVHERGVGETRSCGTGAVATALAVRSWVGDGAPDEWLVDVPGGRLVVSVDGQEATLTGPAMLVFSGELSS